MTDRRPATQLIHGGDGAELLDAAPLTTPVYDTTTFLFDNADQVRAYNEGRSNRYLYSRYANPTVVAVERKIALLEHAESALIFSSGMGATATALFAMLGAGEEVVCSSAVYGGTHHLLTSMGRYGVVTRFASLEELADPSALLGDRTRLLWFETPINPTLRCLDIERIAEACRRRSVVSIIDNTFASPINQNPILFGVDLCMHSATKYLNGHSDVTAGALAGSQALIARIERSRRYLGTILAPGAANLLGRGLKTIELRVERHNANALAVARYLESDRRVRGVSYPGLPDHPDHEIARKQMRGFGGVVTLELDDYGRAARFFDRLQIFRRATSLGGVESLCHLPVLTSHWGFSEEALERAGVTAGMARLSVGLEDPADLIEDLKQALG
jgi:cystathionine gamma-synthase/methionine-gamma-lyase